MVWTFGGGFIMRRVLYTVGRRELLKEIDNLFAAGYDIACVTALSKITDPNMNRDGVATWLIIFKDTVLGDEERG